MERQVVTEVLLIFFLLTSHSLFLSLSLFCYIHLCSFASCSPIRTLQSLAPFTFIRIGHPFLLSLPLSLALLLPFSHIQACAARPSIYPLFHLFIPQTTTRSR